MPSSYTSLLGFVLPVTGELSGTWGTAVNSQLTQLVEDSIAGYATASVLAGNWTLSTTASGASNEARMQILVPTGAPGVSRDIYAPKLSKTYCVINSSDAAVVLRGGPGTPTTGVTIPTGARAFVAWDTVAGDFKFVAPLGTSDGSVTAAVTATTATNIAGGTANQIPYQTGAGTTSFADYVTVAQGGQGIFTIPAPTFSAGAMTLPAAAFTLDFNDIATGVVTRLKATDDALVVPSGATLGLVSGQQSDLIRVEIYPTASTIEQAIVNLVGGNDLSETGVISTTAISTGADSANVFYSNTARTNVPYRVVGLYRSTQTTAGTWAQAMSLIQGSGGQAQFRGASMVRLNTTNGYGSTNNRIFRFTNTVTSQGSDITYTDSATLGASFTINVSGVYSINHSNVFNGVDWVIISLNDTAPAGTPNTVEVIAADTSAGVSAGAQAAWTGYLAAGTVVRARSYNGTATAGPAQGQQFTIARVS